MVPSFEYDGEQRRLRNTTSPPNTNTRMDGGQIQVWCPKYRYAKAQIQGRKCSLFIDCYPKYRSVFAYYMSAPHLKLPNTVPHQINELSE